MDLLRDVKPVTELKQKAAEVIQQVQAEKRPILITHRGRSAALLIDVEEYQRLVGRLTVLEAIVRGKADVVAGRVYPHEEVVKRVRRWQKRQRPSGQPRPSAI